MTAPGVRTVAKAAGLVSVALLLSRVLGYVREAFFAARVGASYTMDAFVVAQEIPMALFAAISTSLVLVFIPVYQDVVQKRGQDAGWQLVSTVLNLLLVVTAGLVLLGWAMAPWVVPLLVPGLPPEPVVLAISLTRTMLPMMLFMAAGGVAAALLNAHRRFTRPALVGLMSNLLVVGTLVIIAGANQIHWVAWAVVAGAAAGALIQWPLVPSLGYRYKASLDWREPAIRRMVQLMIPVVVTTSAVQLQNWVDRYLASWLGEGIIASLNYAVRVNSLPYGVIGISIATVLYPTLAEQAAAVDRAAFRKTVLGGLKTLAAVLLPMAIGILVFRVPITRFFFERGAFDPDATAATAYALGFYALGILFFGWLDFMNRSFFALQDSLTPMWVSVGMVALNIGFNLALVGPLKHGGLALGTSLSALVAVLVLAWRLSKKLGAALDVGDVVRSVGLSLATAGAGALVGWFVYGWVLRLVPSNGIFAQVIQLGAGLGTLVVVYLALALLLGNREGLALVDRVWQRVRRRSEGRGQ